MSTPMMQQYDEMKKKHSDAIILFRLGDFYEAFNEDAKTISKILNITLTGRGKDDNRRPMAGIPHHALKRYLKRLVNAGKKVAIADQMTEPEAGKLVEREVTKIITAGTISDIDYLDESNNNYLLAVFSALKNKSNKESAEYFLSYCDLTTGEFHTATLYDFNDLMNQIYRLHPSEIICPPELEPKLKNSLYKLAIQSTDQSLWEFEKNYKLLTEHFNLKSLKSMGYDKDDQEVIPAGVVFDYMRQTQRTNLEHIKKITKINKTDYMNLDRATIQNLEIIYSRDPENPNASLFGILNECQTAMGQRKLRQWLLNPLINKELIEERLDAVEELIKDPIKLSSIRDSLDNICDLERVVSKIGTGSITARDLLYLKTSLQKIIELTESTKNYKNILINTHKKIGIKKNDLISIISIINQSITEDPPNTIMEGGIIKEGYNSELDEIKITEKEGKNWLKKLQTEEIERTGISSLKVKYNSVFGYYIEVSKSNLDKVPDNYIRKQTLVNAERFITEDLKLWEDKILNANDRANALEYELFNGIKNEVAKHIELLQELGDVVSVLDVLANFAHLSRLNQYTKPRLNVSGKMEIVNARHPVVEKYIKESYISNDLFLDNDENQVIILTGPNMSGKSTYIRQAAIITLMGQAGCFVPATGAGEPAGSANLSIVDRVFTRVGASDNLASGESTFMVEMNETANILNNATERSLIILDEVGRGTSTYDGVAIAWSIVEYIHNKIGAKTLFATHYHELIDLEDKLERVKNYNVQVLEKGTEVIFTRKVIKGGTDQSYGVYVAEMAGVPAEITKRAKEILLSLEQDSLLDVKSIESELIKKQTTSKPKQRILKKVSKKQLKLV